MNLNITVPTLLLDEEKCRKNIQKIKQKATDNQVIIRPHFKTHQSHQVGRWFREAGINQITVSSFRMAEYFAQDAWKDITVAFPVNILEIERINILARNIHLNICCDNMEALLFLEEKLENPVGLYIKINAGNNRSGLSMKQSELIKEMIEKLQNCKQLKFLGFLGHAGQSYKARSKEEILIAHHYSTDLMFQLRAGFSHLFPNIHISLGDTPTCSVADSFPGVDEIRPGNFVYYDVTQYYIGSCTLDEIAVAMACPVVSKSTERNEIVVYGGGVHFSKDRVQRADGSTVFGLLAEWEGNSWKAIAEEQTYVRGLSQEHGIIKTTAERLQKIKIGDVIPILPVHSCMAADIMRSVLTLDGKKLGMIPLL